MGKRRGGGRGRGDGEVRPRRVRSFLYLVVWFKAGAFTFKTPK